MTKLFILAVMLFLLFVFVSQLKAYLARDSKVEELKRTKLEGNLMDIEKEIAGEKARQQSLSSDIENMNSHNEINNNKDNYNDSETNSD